MKTSGGSLSAIDVNRVGRYSHHFIHLSKRWKLFVIKFNFWCCFLSTEKRVESHSKWFLRDNEGGQSGENIRSLSSGNSKVEFYHPVWNCFSAKGQKQKCDEMRVDLRWKKVVAILIVFIHIWILMWLNIKCNFIPPLICLSWCRGERRKSIFVI